jgi:hypothetical protein
MTKKTAWETVRGQGTQILGELKRLIHEGNVRRVVVKQKARVVAEFPLTVGLVGAVAAPLLAAVGALVALLADCTIEVETAREAAKPPRSAKRKVAKPRR